MNIIGFLAGPVSIAVAVIGLISGLIFIINPAFLQRLNQLLNKHSFILERIQQALDRETNTDAWIIRHHKMAGLLIAILSALIVFEVIQSRTNYLIVFAVLGFVLGIVLMANPAALQKLTQFLDKKLFSVEGAQKILDKEITTDEWIISKSKLIGAAVIILALVILLQMVKR